MMSSYKRLPKRKYQRGYNNLLKVLKKCVHLLLPSCLVGELYEKVSFCYESVGNDK